MKTLDYIDLLKKTLGVDSDHAVAKALDISTQQISNYRNMNRTFSDDVAIRVGAILSIPGEAIMADMAAQRAKRTSVKEAWERAAAMLRSAAAGLLVAVLAGFSASPNQANASMDAGDHDQADRFNRLCIIRNYS